MVKHILKDGTQVNDISGVVITQEQFPLVYRIIDKIGRGEKYETVRTSNKCSYIPEMQKP